MVRRKTGKKEAAETREDEANVKLAPAVLYPKLFL